MPLDQLLAALERDARAAADRLLAEAQAKAAQLTAASEQDYAERRDATVRARVSELRAAVAEALADAGREARGNVLYARERLVARVVGALRAALPAAILRPDYRASLPHRVAAALACMDDHEPVVLSCPASLVATLQEAVPERPNLVLKAGDQVGSGFRLTTADGAVEVDDTLEARLETAKTLLVREALRQLESPA